MDIDEEITKLKTQYAHSKKQEEHIYNKACEFHKKMIRKNLPATNKNIIIHDRAIMVIRKYLINNIEFVDMS